MSSTTLRAVRLALASLLLAALVAQLLIGMSRAALTAADFLSFFTILSNTMAVVMLVMLVADPGRISSERFSVFRGAVTVYMTVTGLIYATLLGPAGIDVGLTEPWVNWSLHIIGPLGVVLDWVLNRPETELPPTVVLIWIAFPAAYLVYTLVRGAIVDWYPYPFLDPGETNGYAGVAMWAIVVLAVILVFGYLFSWWARRAPREPAAT
ncbi:MAG TPA: Pr6Pr family membrane protein [Acidimicrobiia bacterium]|jgi:hypothetical protein|nr:Pr6Pr family membrane protein [Acidimicrobiia bacterium]